MMLNFDYLKEIPELAPLHQLYDEPAGSGRLEN